MITALPNLPDTKLLLAGTGEKHQSLGNLARRLGVLDRVTFLGRIPHDQLVKLYSAAAALILASSREGRPVVASNISGPLEIAPAGGILVKEQTQMAWLMPRSICSRNCQPTKRHRNMRNNSVGMTQRRVNWICFGALRRLMKHLSRARADHLMRRSPSETAGSVCVVAIIFLAQLPILSSVASAKEIVVSNSSTLRKAIASAKPGHRIVVMPGEYRLTKQLIRNGGVAGNPITVTALVPAKTRIRSASVELFKLRAPYWIFEKLTFMGTAGTHHALHIVGDADHVVLRGNRFLNFHSAIKGNPENGQTPDHVTLERNIFRNDALRQTTEPTHPIDVVGGDGWILRENFIADFGRTGSRSVSYGAFLKGGSLNGLMERNLVICEWRHSGGRRVGLSFGGGGSSSHLRSKDNMEHDDGIMRNNIIINCPNAEGIYLNRARNSKIFNNTIYNTYGIMARFPAGTSYIRNNIVTGTITERSKARLITERNLTTGSGIGTYVSGIRWAPDTIKEIAAWMSRSRNDRGDLSRWFIAPEVANFELNSGTELLGKGVPLTEVQDDFCGNPRHKIAVDLGAIEYRKQHCDVKAWIAELVRR